MSLTDQQWCPTSVQVTVLQARGLRIKGKNGTNDAYAVMQVGKEKFQTSVVEKSVTPVWKEEATFDLPQLLQGGGGGGGGKGPDRSTLHVHVLHRALVGPDKLLGQAVINLLQLSEDQGREKTEWFKLLDKTGKPDKERGEVLLDVQFMRNNLTASMFDLSAAGKSRSRLGKIKDKVRGKKKESDSASSVVPSLTQVLTDSEEEGDAEGREGKDGKSKKHKMKSLFSPKSNLQKNMSQSMSVLPGKNSSLSGSQSSGLNVDSSEGKKKFKFSLHKRSGSSDGKTSTFGHQKQAPVEQSNLCINGNHVYCEEPQPRTTRAGSNFSLISSGHGSMEDVPEDSPPSVDSLKAARQYSPWMEEEEDADESKEEAEEERQKKEETLRRQQEELEKFEKEKLRREEEMRLKAQNEEEERKRGEEMRKQQEELQRLAEEKLREERREAEEERAKREEEERIIVQREEEERKRREEEMEEMHRQQVELERLAKEEKLKQEEEERRRVEEERIKVQREEEERLAQEKARQEEQKRLAEEMKKLEEEKRQKEEEDRINREEEEKAQERKRQEEEHRLAEDKRLEEEEKERVRRENERAEEERRRKEELVRKQEQKRQMEEEERARKEREEHEKFMEEKRRVEAEEKARKDEEERARMEEEQRQREQQEEERRREEEMLRRREELEKLAQEKLRQEEERREAERAKEEERVRKEEARKQEEERIRKEEEMKEEARRQEEERVRKEEEMKEEARRQEEERARRQEEERVRKEEEMKEEARRREEERREEEERIRKREENERLEEERRRLEEQEKRRIEEMEIIRKEEQERIRKEEEKREREERARKEKEELDRVRNQEEQEKRRKEEEERVRREETERKEAEKKQKETKTIEQKVAKKKLKLIPTEILSTNPFDEDFSPSESSSSSAPEPPICSTKSETVQRCDSAVPSVTSVSADEKDLFNAQREKRPAPKPPGRSQPEKPRRDLSALQQINEQSKEKDVRTVSVPPQRSVQMIAPLNSSSTKRPAPSRPHSVEEPSSNKTSHRGVPETKPVKTSQSLNPFDDDENELAAQDDVTKSAATSPLHWPPADPQTADKDDTSPAKVKSLKVARAPAPPPPSDSSSSPLIYPNDGGPLTGGPDPTMPDQACDPEPEVKRTVQVQESPNKDTQPAKGQKVMVAGVKEEGPPVNSRRLQTVKPLNPLEKQPASVQEENNKSSGLDCGKVQHNTKVITGPYSQLTREELISLVLKQEKQLADKDKKISELELYIDNLLVRVIEVQPSILMSMSSIK
ncbi:rab11 family-interacting protein 1 [Austrofundulus limnaeus]|uniref:Rab11 family-interacting protein 1 n=1 Tax=Austrofundulus limnaeus TaxID=52670 RepID=A0A2I4AUE1_AUSLI|nr:PREDICTED: rab11 family-interacting protein 1-like [Austrofundulus limnaeus]